jgi:hypothetical protein
MKIVKSEIPYLKIKTQCFVFLPDPGEVLKPTWALFTHGYTSDKSSILNWSVRLAEMGVASVLFDLPGHYLGNFSEVDNFSDFKNHAHELFQAAYVELHKNFLENFPLEENFTTQNNFQLVFGGHSLGAMLAIKALKLDFFKDFKRRAIGVGIGMAPKHVVHIFDTPFYQATLKVRSQLVSKELNPDNVFPWIKQEKADLKIANEHIHLITGIDDLVVGDDGLERFMEKLQSLNNTVTFEKPTKLPHHEPELASGHIKKYFKAEKLV